MTIFLAQIFMVWCFVSPPVWQKRGIVAKLISLLFCLCMFSC